MNVDNRTVLDSLLEKQPVPFRLQQIMVSPDELVHIVDPKNLYEISPMIPRTLNAGWLKIDYATT
jgi:hypothetical protein